MSTRGEANKKRRQVGYRTPSTRLRLQHLARGPDAPALARGGGPDAPAPRPSLQAELDQLAKTMAEMQAAKGKDRKEEAKEREREKEKAAKAAAAAKGKGKEGKPKTVVIKAL